jgi:hypothetical protein
MFVLSSIQLALNHADLDETVAFYSKLFLLQALPTPSSSYSKLFATEPAKVRPGDANIAIADPPLKLVLIEDPGQAPTRSTISASKSPPLKWSAQGRLASLARCSTSTAWAGFVATTRPDGGPRGPSDLPGPGKRPARLHRGGTEARRAALRPRYALHSETLARPRHEEGTYVAGRVQELEDPPLQESLTEQILPERSLAEPWPASSLSRLMELHLHSVLITLTEARDGLPAGHTVWRP